MFRFGKRDGVSCLEIFLIRFENDECSCSKSVDDCVILEMILFLFGIDHVAFRGLIRISFT